MNPETAFDMPSSSSEAISVGVPPNPALFNKWAAKVRFQSLSGSCVSISIEETPDNEKSCADLLLKS